MNAFDHHLRDRIGSSSTTIIRTAVLLSAIYTIRGYMLSLMYSASCMATIDGVDDCHQILYRVNVSSLQPGISGTTMTTTPPRTSTAMCRAWFAGISLPRRGMWRRGTRCHVEFLLSLHRCWQTHVTPGRWFFADISRGMHVVALHQPAKWSKSQSCIYLHQHAEWSWIQNRTYLRQPIECSKCQSRVDILTLPCMLWQHY